MVYLGIFVYFLENLNRIIISSLLDISLGISITYPLYISLGISITYVFGILLNLLLLCYFYKKDTYLKLNYPRLRYLIIGFLWLTLIVILLDFFGYLGSPYFLVNAFKQYILKMNQSNGGNFYSSGNGGGPNNNNNNSNNNNNNNNNNNHNSHINNTNNNNNSDKNKILVRRTLDSLSTARESFISNNAPSSYRYTLDIRDWAEEQNFNLKYGNYTDPNS